MAFCLQFLINMLWRSLGLGLIWGGSPRTQFCCLEPSMLRVDGVLVPLEKSFRAGRWSVLISCSDQQNKQLSEDPFPAVAIVALHFLTPSTSGFQAARVGFFQPCDDVWHCYWGVSSLVQCRCCLLFWDLGRDLIRISARLSCCSSWMQTPKRP